MQNILQILLTFGGAGSPDVVWVFHLLCYTSRRHSVEAHPLVSCPCQAPCFWGEIPAGRSRGQLMNFLCLLPPCVFFSCFRWARGPELVLRTPRVLEAAFLYKLGTELATRDWKSGRQNWLGMLRRACNFTAACPLGSQWKTRLSAANICVCDSIVLSEDEISWGREPRTKLKCSLLFHGIMRNGRLGSPPPHPTLQRSLWFLTQCSSIFLSFQLKALPFQKVPVPL